MRILIAEDDLTSRTLLAAVLRKFGHEVTVTEDGAAAWAALQRPDAPRCAILDWMMPEFDGPELCRRVRKLETSRPPWLLMLTTRGEKTDTVTALDAGADDFLTKPYDLGELRARVNAAERILQMQDHVATQVEELQKALARIAVLEGMLPICGYCKQIRDDHGAWQRVDHYLEAHTRAQFTHSICPTCLEKNFPED